MIRPKFSEIESGAKYESGMPTVDDRLKLIIENHLKCGQKIWVDDLARKLRRLTGDNWRSRRLLEVLEELFPRALKVGSSNTIQGPKSFICERKPTCSHARSECWARKIKDIHSL